MKLLAVLCVVVPLTLGAKLKSWENDESADMFKVWKSKYNKEYEYAEDEAKRFAIWKDKLDFVGKHNIRHSLGMETFTVEMNEFADMTADEFRTQKLGFVGTLHAPSENSEVDVTGLPSSVDWRSQGYVTDVKDQGQCGSCWSFSTTGSLEGQHFNATGSLISLSEQQLVSCDRTDYGCNGGNFQTAWTWLRLNGGSNSEADYPYVSGTGYAPACKSGYPVYATVDGYVSIARGSESSLQQATATVGPISVAIDASKFSFQLYSSGVYYEPNCSSYRLDHAVLVVGYGTDSGSDYWLVKNSWGKSWGMDGYIEMSRNRNNNCGIATGAAYPTV